MERVLKRVFIKLPKKKRKKTEKKEKSVSFGICVIYFDKFDVWI